MDSLIAWAVSGTPETGARAGTVAGLGDDTPATPSIPVQIGTGGIRRVHAEAASWQMLILMLFAVIVIGSAVLLYVVRQRRRLLERRRLRRMAEAVSRAGEQAAVGVKPMPAVLAIPVAVKDLHRAGSRERAAARTTAMRTAPRKTPPRPHPLHHRPPQPERVP